MWSDRESKLDVLNVQHLVAAVETVVTTEDLLPVTVGVFGDWGSGKSTVMRLTRQRLEASDDILCVYFNGWLFEGYEDAKAAILGTILDKLADERGAMDKAGELFTKLLKRVNWLRLAGWGGKALMLAHGIPPVGSGLVSDALQKTPDVVKELVKEAPEGEDNVRRTLREFERDFAELLAKTGVRVVVVFIDDLDRCLPTTIIETLEAIRLFVFVEGMAFVIAADERLVRSAVHKHFPDVQTPVEFAPNYPSRDVGREYLEKLIQVPVHVPPLSRAEIETYVNILFAQRHLTKEEITGFCESVCQRIAQSVGNDVVFNLSNAEEVIGRKVDGELAEDLALAAQIGVVLAASVQGNPRQTKRFLNALLLRLKMAEARGVKLERRVTAKLMLLEYFQPALFQSLASWQANQNGRPHELELLEKWSREQSQMAEPTPVAVEAAEDSGDGKKKRARTVEKESDEAEKAKPAEELPPQLHPWINEPWVRAWLKTEPTLVGVHLGPHFFFARERVGAIGQLVSEMSPVAVKVLGQMIVASEASQMAGTKVAEQLKPSEASSVFAELLRRASSNEGLDAPHSPLAAMIRFVAARAELQNQLVSFVGALPITSIGLWAPPMLANAITGHEYSASLTAIFGKWKEAGGPLAKVVEMTERPRASR